MNRRRFARALAWLAALGAGRARAVAGPVASTGEAARLDRLGDPIPPRALIRIGTTRFRDRPRTCGLESFALSPDGRLIATGSLHDPATLWDAATGRVVRRLGTPPAKSPGYSIRCHGLAFSADGATLAVGRPGRSSDGSCTKTRASPGPAARSSAGRWRLAGPSIRSAATPRRSASSPTRPTARPS